MLVKIQTNEQGEQLVSARTLHEKLEIKRDFTTWIKARIGKYGFKENVDFTTVWNDTKTGVVKKFNGSIHSMVKLGYEINYILKLDMAKEISMIENNDKGRQIRQYFIQCEKQYYSLAKKANEIEFNPNLRRIQESVTRIKDLEAKIRGLQKEITKEYDTILGRAAIMKDTIKNGDLHALTLKEYKKG